MILSVSLWLHIHRSKMRELRGRSEFAKSTFGVFSAVSTYLADSGLMCCVTSAVSMSTGLMPTTCQSGKSWIIFRPTSCVTILSRTCMLLARVSRIICLTHILTSQIRPTMIVLKRVCFSEMTWPLLISGCVAFVQKKVMMLSDPKHWDHILPLCCWWSRRRWCACRCGY